MAFGFPANLLADYRHGSCSWNCVSLPRRVVPGTTYKISRRCLDRRFYLVPSETANNILLYSLAHAAAKHGVRVHSFVVQSNHPHLVVTDVRGVLPAFLRDLHRDIALALKELHGIPENLWSDAQTSCVELLNEAAQLQAAAYAVLNPVTANLVFRASEWPGLICLPGQRRFVARRPEVYFGTSRAESVELLISAPPAWAGSEDQWHTRLGEFVAAQEDSLAAVRRRDGRAVLGRERVLHQDPFERPRDRRATGPKRNPVVAAGGDHLALTAAIHSLRAWRTAYLEARPRWTDDKATVFPRGTWWLVQHAGALAA